MLCSLGVVSLGAAEVWQTKKFNEWTEKDIRKIVRNSPWARTVDIRVGELRGPSGGGGRRGRRGGGGGMPSVDASSGSMGTLETNADAAGRGEGDSFSIPTYTVIVRCHSAMPIKQAIVRTRFGDGALTAPEAISILRRPEPFYVWTIAGIPMQLLRGDAEAGLKQQAFLKIKGKAAIPAADVKLDQQERLLNLFLYFPREGHPITVEDGDVEVQVKLPQANVRRVFKLKDMVFEGKLEI